jgi:hypothetical protein
VHGRVLVLILVIVLHMCPWRWRVLLHVHAVLLVYRRRGHVGRPRRYRCRLSGNLAQRRRHNNISWARRTPRRSFLQEAIGNRNSDTDTQTLTATRACLRWMGGSEAIG